MYLRYLGAENFAIIGIYYSLMAVFSLFDFGFSTGLSRELSRNPNSKENLKLFKNLEFLFLIFSLLLLLIYFLFSKFIIVHFFSKNLKIILDLHFSFFLVGICLFLVINCPVSHFIDQGVLSSSHYQTPSQHQWLYRIPGLTPQMLPLLPIFHNA